MCGFTSWIRSQCKNMLMPERLGLCWWTLWEIITSKFFCGLELSEHVGKVDELCSVRSVWPECTSFVFAVTALLRKLKQQSRESVEDKRPRLLKALKEVSKSHTQDLFSPLAPIHPPSFPPVQPPHSAPYLRVYIQPILRSLDEFSLKAEHVACCLKKLWLTLVQPWSCSKFLWAISGLMQHTHTHTQRHVLLSLWGRSINIITNAVN